MCVCCLGFFSVHLSVREARDFPCGKNLCLRELKCRSSLTAMCRFMLTASKDTWNIFAKGLFPSDPEFSAQTFILKTHHQELIVNE